MIGVQKLFRKSPIFGFRRFFCEHSFSAVLYWADNQLICTAVWWGISQILEYEDIKESLAKTFSRLFIWEIICSGLVRFDFSCLWRKYLILLRKNYGKVEDRLNYTEIVCMGIKTKDHSDFMNELNLRMILWSTAEAVLRHLTL